MKIPTYEEAKKGRDPLDVFVLRWEPLDSKSYRAYFREDLQKLIDYIVENQEKDRKDEK